MANAASDENAIRSEAIAVVLLFTGSLWVNRYCPYINNMREY